jgi:predicted flap endonuclease-1-like 5' DNA nuclease
MGVDRWAQIAGWSDGDLEEAATALRLSAKRIRKLGWVENARLLV